MILKIGRQGSGNGEFDNPCDISCDSTGKLYVADRNNHRIQIFTAEGEFMTKFEKCGENRNPPSGIAIDTSGLIYVSKNHFISTQCS